MKNKFQACFMLLCMSIATHLQAQLNIAEYFFDQDPGVGNGYALSGFNVNSGLDYDSASYAGNIAIPSTLQPGKHILCVRSGKLMTNGEVYWSTYMQRPFTVNLASGNNWVAGEYFYDQDPGVGNAIPISFNPQVDSSNYLGSVSTVGLSDGAHNLHVRVQHASGNWSAYESRRIHVLNGGQGITQLEYFFDNDPGIGAGFSLPISSTSDSVEFSGNINTSGLLPGYHHLNVRGKNALGSWSTYVSRKIRILNNGISLVAAEYFFDTDPGPGNGLTLSLNALADSASYLGDINTTGLGAGRHYVHVRVKDLNGVWSTYATRRFELDNAIVQGEFFFDTDPGIGQATSFTLAPTTLATSEFSGNLLSSSNLLHGDHWLYVRAQASDGSWSNYDSLGVYIDCSNPTIGQVIQSSVTSLCGEEGIVLSLANSNLNEATAWHWYTGNCGATLEAIGDSIFVLPSDTTTYYVRGEGGCTNVFTCVPVQVNFNPASHVDLKLFLEGYYLPGASMQPTLFNEGQPTCTGVTDTVYVDLVDPITQNVLHTQKSIVHTDGTIRCNFSPFLGDYYVGIRHRNSIETWSALPITLSNNLLTYDFTTSSLQAYAQNMKEVEPGIWALYTGDMNQDNVVDIFDYLVMEPDIINGQFGYLVSDLNGDGSADAFDFLLLAPNIEEGISALIPF